MKRKRHNRERKKDWLERKRQVILTAKANCPDQNAINLKVTSATKLFFAVK